MKSNRQIDILKAGQIARVRLHGSSDEWCPALVVLVSQNGESVGLLLRGMIRASHGGLIGGTLPLTIDFEHATITSLFGDRYELEVWDE